MACFVSPGLTEEIFRLKMLDDIEDNENHFNTSFDFNSK